MAKKRRHGGANAPPRKAASPKDGFGSPFKDLKAMLAQASKTAAKTSAIPSSGGKAAGAEGPRISPASPSPRPAAPTRAIANETQQSAQNSGDELLDDEAILRRALEGVRPLNGDRRVRTPIEPPTNNTIVDEDAEVIAQLSDLVSGQAPFDITESDEYVEGYRVGR